MAPLIVMLVSWLVARSIGVSGMWYQAALWTGALRIALAAMFVSRPCRTSIPHTA